MRSDESRPVGSSSPGPAPRGGLVAGLSLLVLALGGIAIAVAAALNLVHNNRLLYMIFGPIAAICFGFVGVVIIIGWKRARDLGLTQK